MYESVTINWFNSFPCKQTAPNCNYSHYFKTKNSFFYETKPQILARESLVFIKQIFSCRVEVSFLFFSAQMYIWYCYVAYHASRNVCIGVTTLKCCFDFRTRVALQFSCCQILYYSINYSPSNFGRDYY